MLHRKRLLVVPRKRCSSLRVSCLRITLDLCQWLIAFIRRNPKRLSTVCYDRAFLWGYLSDGKSLGLNAGDLVMARRIDATRRDSPSDNTPRRAPLKSYIQIKPSRFCRRSHVDFRHTYVSRNDDRNGIFNIKYYNVRLIQAL